MATLKLSKLQRDRLYIDTYAECPEGEEGTTVDHGEVWGDAEGIALREELRHGRIVTISAWLISELKEMSDRDGDTNERRMYNNLLRKAQQ